LLRGADDGEGGKGFRGGRPSVEEAGDKGEEFPLLLARALPMRRDLKSDEVGRNHLRNM
jgi:hypothetical protein